MAIRPDSYGSVAQVTAFTRHLLDGALAFDWQTRPTLEEVETFIDQASSVLNLALAGAGLVVPVVNSTAKMALGDWVTARATEYVELTQRGVGYSDAEGSRVSAFRNLSGGAARFVKENELALKRLGAGVAHASSEGLRFTGIGAPGGRPDPGNSGLEQPKFGRTQFEGEG